MPWYRVTYHPGVIADLAKVDRGLAQRLFEKTKWLASNVQNLRHEPVATDLPTLSKYAIGDWRIFYALDREDHLLDVVLIARRRDLRS